MRVTGHAPFSDFLMALYRLARESTPDRFADDAFALLGGSIGFDSARVGSGRMDARTQHRRPHHWHLFGELQDLSIPYAEVTAQDEPMQRLVFAEGRCMAVHYESAERFRSREFSGIRAYQRRFAHESVLTVADSARRGEGFDFQFVSLYRALRGRPFDAHDVAFCRAAWPHLLESSTLSAVASARALDWGCMEGCEIAIADLSGLLLNVPVALHNLFAERWPSAARGSVPCEIWERLARGATRVIARDVVVTARRIGRLVFLKVRRAVAADSLSTREQEVARMIAQGFTHKQVARELGIALATARNHVQRIHGKLQTRNAAQVCAALAALA